MTLFRRVLRGSCCIENGKGPRGDVALCVGMDCAVAQRGVGGGGSGARDQACGMGG
jgi:hypothetical protein